MTDVELVDVSTEEAHAAWAEAARGMLVRTARRYHHVLSVKEVAAGVAEETGMIPAQRATLWIDDVLDLVGAECARRGEPDLSALCVNVRGSVGDRYAARVAEATGVTPDNPDTHAAAVRLECHRHFEAPGLPADGGVPVLTLRLSQARSRERKAILEARPATSCPTCFMVLPTQGPCNNCE